MKSPRINISILIFVLSLFLLLALSCEKGKYEGNNILLPVVGTDNSYQFTEIKISSLTEIQPLQSSIINIYENTIIEAKEQTGDTVVTEDEELITPGDEVYINYKMESGIVVPTDFRSVATLSVIYLFEQTEKFYENNFNLDINDFGKITIHYSPIFSVREEGVSGDFTLFGNAAFNPIDKSFIIFGSSIDEEIPLSLNQGVITHEFTHAVIDKYTRDTGKYSIYMNYNAIHEGIADFFAVIHTSRKDYFTSSMPDSATSRSLPVSWVYEEVDDKAEELYASDFPAYIIGSVIASSLIEAQESINIGGKEIAELVFNTFSLLGDSLALEDGDDYALYKYLEILSANSGSNLNPLCNSFKKWFSSIYSDISSCSGI